MHNGLINILFMIVHTLLNTRERETNKGLCFHFCFKIWLQNQLKWKENGEEQMTIIGAPDWSRIRFTFHSHVWHGFHSTRYFGWE